VITTLALVSWVGAAEPASPPGTAPEWVTWVIALLVAGGGGGGLYQILKVRSDRRNAHANTAKARAEAADILSDTALSLLEPLRDQLAALREELATMERKLHQERETANARIVQLEADIAERDRQIRAQHAEIVQLRRYAQSSPGWPEQRTAGSNS
jgi:hypothetical protein